MIDLIELFEQLLYVSALGLSAYLALTLGRKFLNVFIVPFFLGVVLLNLVQIFFLFYESGIFRLHTVTFHVLWHFLLYLAILEFAWGALKLRELTQSGKITKLSINEFWIPIGGLVAAGIIFSGANYLEAVFGAKLIDSPVDRLGLHHLAAFIIIFVTAVMMFYIRKNWGQVLAIGTSPFLLFLFFLGGQHLWEFLTESIKIIPLEEMKIEQIELMFTVPALLFLNLAILRILVRIKSLTRSFTEF